MKTTLNAGGKIGIPDEKDSELETLSRHEQ